MDSVFILVLALAIDLAFGEPPNAWHPVAWLGKVISLEMKGAPKGAKAQFVYGIAMVVLTVAIIMALVYFSLIYLRQLNSAAYILAAALIFKLTFSIRELRQAAVRVKKSLIQDNLEQARSHLSALVHRDTAGLSKPQAISATVESVAENSCDSFVAPLFYFLFFGVPGAAAYRMINTFDAMIGFRGKWEYLGKFAARLDDVVNFIPARLAALVLIVASWISGKDARQAWQIMWRDHRLTESPNAGWTMSAAAGALGVRLEKVGCYCLGDNHYPLSEKTIDSSLRLLAMVTVVWSLTCLLPEVVHLVLAY